MSVETPPSPPSDPTPQPEPISAQPDPQPKHEPEPETHKPEPETHQPEPAPVPNQTGTDEPGIVESSSSTTTEKPKGRSFIQPAVSFKEESNLLSDLSISEKSSLDDLKKLLNESIDELKTTLYNNNEAEISIWGIPLLEDERTDVILLKFLRARDFKVVESMSMLKATLKWRRDFAIDELVAKDNDNELVAGGINDLEKVVFMHGHDREGHPVCYNVYGEFQNKELYAKMFSTEEKRGVFLKRRILFLEKSIRKQLDFWPGGVSTIFQVNDLKNAPGPGKRELRQATRQALQLLQDNYPEFVAKQVFINVPWWYVAFYTMMSPFMTQRTKSKFVFAGPSKTAETLFKYASPEQVPIQYGGLSVDYCDCDPEFTVDDPATEINLKPTTKQYVEIICSEKCIIDWELRVVGWEVTYSAEFVPNTKEGYTVIIQKSTKMSPHDDPVISGSFKVSELGKIVLTVDNPTFKKRKLLYRYKVLPYSD